MDDVHPRPIPPGDPLDLGHDDDDDDDDYDDDDHDDDHDDDDVGDLLGQDDNDFED